VKWGFFVVVRQYGDLLTESLRRFLFVEKEAVSKGGLGCLLMRVFAGKDGTVSEAGSMG
jgi:hypothetical protein